MLHLKKWSNSKLFSIPILLILIACPLTLHAHAEEKVVEDQNSEVASSISGFVWVDKNKNGVLDKAEQKNNALSDVAVSLYDASKNKLESTTTVNGQYSFTSLIEGIYYIGIEKPEGLEPTLPVASGVKEADSHMYLVDETSTIDFSEKVFIANNDIEIVNGGYLEGQFVPAEEGIVADATIGTVSNESVVTKKTAPIKVKVTVKQEGIKEVQSKEKINVTVPVVMSEEKYQSEVIRTLLLKAFFSLSTFTLLVIHN